MIRWICNQRRTVLYSRHISWGHLHGNSLRQHHPLRLYLSLLKYKLVTYGYCLVNAISSLSPWGHIMSSLCGDSTCPISKRPETEFYGPRSNGFNKIQGFLSIKKVGES